MFGFRNFTGLAFMGKIVNITFEFAAGIVEEVTLNVTAANTANALEIQENFNLNLVTKDQIIISTALAVSSKILQINGFDLIAAPTPNLF